MNHVLLDNRVVKTVANETFGLVDGICRVDCHHVFGSFSNESLTLREDNTGWRGSVAVVIDNDLNLNILKDIAKATEESLNAIETAHTKTLV